MSRAKYIVGAAVLAGVIASGYCSFDPAGPLLLLTSLLAGVILAVAAVIMRKGRDVFPLLVCSILSVVFFPSLIDRCRGLSNDEAAIANLQTLVVAEVTYQATTSTHGKIEHLVEDGLVDDRFRSVVSGYRYGVTISPDGSYVARATRDSAVTGRNDYFTRGDGTIQVVNAR